MPTLTCFHLGNADSCLIDLTNSEKILFDFGNQRDPNNKYDLRCDLAAELRADLKKGNRDYFDVVAFTHLDRDHYQGASEFFYLEHAAKYQGPGRIKMNVMWVPAAMITEGGIDEPEGRIIRAEARHRLKAGKGIRVFSRPQRLKKWLEDQGIKPTDREHLITDAGQLAPEFTLAKNGVEFFVHCPFAKRMNEAEVEDRNGDSIVMQATFSVEGVETKILLGSDIHHPVITDIVEITKKHKRENRLEWDVCKVPHHCSYKSLGPDKGEDETKPVPEVAWLFEQQGHPRAILVSSSESIPAKGTAADEDPYPPHRQAAAYYRKRAKALGGEFKVTMEHPKKEKPAPLVVDIGKAKASIQKEQSYGGIAIVSTTPPRAG